MIKLLKGLLFMGLVWVGIISNQQAASASMGMCSSEVITRGDIGPWPFGLEQPFPWEKIDAVWRAEIGGCNTYFTFKTIRDGRNVRRLIINQVDPDTCYTVAKGLGVQLDDNPNVVSASVTGVNGPMFLTVHVFKESDIKETRSKNKSGAASAIVQSNRNVTVLSVQSLTDPNRVVGHYKLVKVAEDLMDVCKRP